jgi:hypothetical protein
VAYALEPVAIPRPHGGILRIEGKSGAEIVAGVIDELADRILEAQKQFIFYLPKGSQINAVVLTGGGALISRLRDALIGFYERMKGTSIYDLLANVGPDFFPHIQRADRSWTPDTTRIEKWMRQSQMLMRGASALGGCSVFFGLPFPLE